CSHHHVPLMAVLRVLAVVRRRTLVAGRRTLVIAGRWTLVIAGRRTLVVAGRWTLVITGRWTLLISPWLFVTRWWTLFLVMAGRTLLVAVCVARRWALFRTALLFAVTLAVALCGYRRPLRGAGRNVRIVSRWIVAIPPGRPGFALRLFVIIVRNDRRIRID